MIAQPDSTGPDVMSVQVEVTLPGRQRAREVPEQAQQSPVAPRPTPRIPRITRLMALAIKFQDMVDRGEVRDYADLARLGYVTRARVTQIMNMLLLAPEIQETLLNPEFFGRQVHERHLRKIAALVAWHDQRRSWQNSLREAKR
jgi:hypothetical protein